MAKKCATLPGVGSCKRIDLGEGMREFLRGYMEKRLHSPKMEGSAKNKFKVNILWFCSV